MTPEELLAAYDADLRNGPGHAPVGAVVERDGPLVRVHYGTHGTVDHGPLTGPVDGVIARQQEVFAARDEPVEWRVHAHDSGDLAARLEAAGFRRGWERSVMVGALGQAWPDPAAWLPWATRAQREELGRLAERTGPHGQPFDGFDVDEPDLEGYEPVVVRDGQVVAGLWAYDVVGTPFLRVGGIADPGLEHVGQLCEWRWQRAELASWQRRPGARLMVVEADGALRDALRDNGMCEITTLTSYHWGTASGATTRPVTALFDHAEHDRMWERFEVGFGFRPSVHRFPGISEPAGSVTWHLRHGPGDLDRIVRDGLRACVRPGEPLYWLDWQHVGYRFDPARVGGPGLPPWPGWAYPDGDYYLYLTPDLRLGTFGHPWEHTVCVFGAELLAEVERPLTALLGPAVRRN